MTSSQIIILLLFTTLILSCAKYFPSFALSRPVALLMSLVAILLSGVAAVVFLPVELMPNNSFGIITITTPVRGGMSPTEIERQITKPIEEVVATVSYLRNVISNSANGKSVVSLEFEPGTNMDFATLDVREKFSKIKGDLPRDIEPPIIAHFRESDVPVHIVAFTSEKKSPEELRLMVDRELKEKLLRVKGVANVDVAGGRERKIIIDVDKNRLFSHGYDIRRLVREIEEGNLNVKAGELRSTSLETSIRTTGQYVSVDEIANTVIGVTKQGTSLYVKDVARVRDDYLEQESLARLNSSAAVTLYIQKDSISNTVQVVKRTRKILNDFKKTLPADVNLVEISNQAEAILQAVSSVRESLVVGVLLIFLILGLFLGVSPAAVVAISIPLSALCTMTLMYLEHLTVNVMTLSGLALGIGLLIDNAIVVLEIILQKKTSGSHMGAESIQASTESVAPAIIGGTLTSIVVFIPFFILSKQLQILYSGMAITITMSLLSSLYVALTTVPYLANRFKEHLMGGAKHGVERVQLFLERIKEQYTRLLPKVIERRTQALLGAIVLFLASVYVFQFHIEKNFSTGEESNEFIVFVELPSGKRLDISDRIVKEVEKKIRENPSTQSSIKTVTSRIDGWSSKVYVTLQPGEKRKLSTQQVISELRPLLNDIGKDEEAFVYFSSAKSGQELTVNVYGEDEKTTANYAMQIAELFGKTPGFVDTKIRYRPGRPELKIIINPIRCALFGLDPTEVGNILHAQTRGLRATYFHQAGQEIETIVRLQTDQRDSIDAIKQLLIESPNGAQVTLSQIASFDYSLAPSEIWRNNKERMIQVSSNIEKLSLEGAATQAQLLLSQIPFNTDYWAEIGGDYNDRRQAQRDFFQAIILTCLLIFAVLACLFESLLQPLLLFVSVPLSAIGIVIALLLTGTSVTMGVMIGILMTGGIVVNHAILYIDHFNAHRTSSVGASAGAHLVDDLLDAGRSRLRPILMTKATTVLGLLPLAMDRGNGAELWRPMAITTIGGILSSMVLTLFVLPALIYQVEEWRREGELLGKARAALNRVWIFIRQHGMRLNPGSVKSVFWVLLLISSINISGWTSEQLPAWVDGVVNRRVNDLLAEANVFERKKEFAKAIEINLEAVRLAPQNVKARQQLLRANAKGLKAFMKGLDKKRAGYVTAALQKHRATSTWQEALMGKVKEAERLSNRGRLLEACDALQQILGENPTYVPAIKGLESLQATLTRDLEQGGHFSSDENRQAARGFWYFNQCKWKEAQELWGPLLADPASAKKWGSVRLGAYAAKASANEAKEVRQEKIINGIEEGLKNFRDGKLNEAEASFQAVLALDPSHPQAKEYVRMIPGLKERVRTDVLTEVHEKQLANTLSDALEFYLKGFYGEADAKVELVLKEAPDHPQALALSEDIRKARGLPALPTADEKTTEERLKIETLYSDGIIYFAEGRYTDAKAKWDEVLRQDPSNTRAIQALKKLSEDQPKQEGETK